MEGLHGQEGAVKAKHTHTLSLSLSLPLSSRGIRGGPRDSARRVHKRREALKGELSWPTERKANGMIWGGAVLVER